jgi:hypothetical protein
MVAVRKKRHVVVAIECDLPPGISPGRFKQYLLDETKEGNVGQLPTEDPLFDLNRDSVRATVLIDKDFVIIVERMLANPIWRRQAIALLKNNLVTREWFA